MPALCRQVVVAVIGRVSALLPEFDRILRYDETRAVEPLQRTGHWNRGELSETFPSTL
ncbi:MAG TPA: hypothetical protein VL157_10935 [Gemmatimonadaceae bacterium]|jgi:hypothetical protein|nr:hypothetical protein [Gemmatimonadaceae bacterium]